MNAFCQLRPMLGYSYFLPKLISYFSIYDIDFHCFIAFTVIFSKNCICKFEVCVPNNRIFAHWPIAYCIWHKIPVNFTYQKKKGSGHRYYCVCCPCAFLSCLCHGHLKKFVNNVVNAILTLFIAKIYSSKCYAMLL